jgi:ribosomal protein S18 acetylase RimI-like enzyme
MTLTPTLRPALAADYDIIVTWVRDAQECDRWAGKSMPWPLTGAQLAAFIAQAPGIVPGETRSNYTLAAQGEVLAYGELVCENPASYRLARIIVDRERRGAGNGRALCAQLVDKALEQPRAERLRLFVYEDNAAAKALYASLGFKETALAGGSGIRTMERAAR